VSTYEPKRLKVVRGSPLDTLATRRRARN
jgi:hypothetical protein